MKLPGPNDITAGWLYSKLHATNDQTPADRYLLEGLAVGYAAKLEGEVQALRTQVAQMQLLESENEELKLLLRQTADFIESRCPTPSASIRYALLSMQKRREDALRALDKGPGNET